MQVSIRSTMIAEYIMQNLSNKMTYGELYTSLKAVYVKNMEDYDKFDRAFNKVFEKRDTHSGQDSYEDENSIQEDGQEDIGEISSQQNLEQLQQLYNQMMENAKQENSDYEEMLKGSLILLNGWNPRVFELCRKLRERLPINDPIGVKNIIHIIYVKDNKGKS